MAENLERILSIIETGIYRPNLHYEVVRVSSEGEKYLSLVRLLRENEGTGIIYAGTIKAIKSITDYLMQSGFEVAPYHSQISPKERAENKNRFITGGIKAIVASNIFGSFGTDVEKPDIRFVIHYNLPGSLDAYYQESRRAGCDGRPARCTLLFQLAERRTQIFFLSGRSQATRDAVSVYRTMQLLWAGEAAAPLQQIQEQTSQVAKTRVHMILSLLKSAGVVKEHRGARYTLINAHLGAQEIEEMTAQEWSREESEREKLERMILYGQSPECRWKLLLDYLCRGTGMRECGHCDNCEHPVAEQFAATESVSKPDFIDLLFAYHREREERIRPGDVVRLPAHGEVKVKAVEGDKIVVSFPSGETRKFKQEWIIR
jgi:ATP-dependent DNA helicase RecQ